MAHNLAVVNGVAQYAGRIPGWHKLGIDAGRAFNGHEAQSMCPMLTDEIVKHELMHPITGMPLGMYGIFRVDGRTGDHVFLKYVAGPGYTPIQSSYLFEMTDTLLEAFGNAHYETVGALGNGERIWTLANINGNTDPLGIGDMYQTRLLCSTSHDGSQAFNARLTSTRVVCQNTLNAAMVGKSGMYAKHTKEAKVRLDAARKLAAGALQDVETLNEKLRLLAARKVQKESMTASLKRIFGDYETATTARIANKIEDVLRLFESNDGDAFPQVRGTAYNLLNSVTEYIDHFAPVRETSARQGMEEQDMRTTTAIFGTGMQAKQSALEIILEETKDAPYHTINSVIRATEATMAKPVLPNT